MADVDDTVYDTDKQDGAQEINLKWHKGKILKGRVYWIWNDKI